MAGMIEVIRQIAAAMEGYGEMVFKALASGCATLFATVFGCWFVWQLIWKGIMQGQLEIRDFAKYLLTCLAINSLLQADLYFEWLYKPLSSLSSGLIQHIIQAASRDIKPVEPTMFGVIKSQYDALDQVYHVLGKMMQDGGLGNFINPVASLLMQLPFMFIYFMTICYFLNYLFNLMVVTALSPLLIIFAGFESTRSTTTSALKLLLHGTLTVACSVLAMGATIYTLTLIVDEMPIARDGSLKASAESFAFSMHYWKCFLMCCLAIFLQLCCPKIASIAGFSDGPGAAAFVSGFAATSMVAVKAASMNMLGKVGNRAKKSLKNRGDYLRTLDHYGSGSGNASYDKITHTGE